MARLAHPDLPPGRLKDFNEALHELHLLAGCPSLRTMRSEIGREYSVGTIHNAFSKPCLPVWGLVKCLITALVPLTPSGSNKIDAEYDGLHLLWSKAFKDSDPAGYIEPESNPITQSVTKDDPYPQVMHDEADQIARFYIILDCSAGMEDNGQIGELNFCMREIVPEFIASSEGQSQPLSLQAITIGSKPRWHLEATRVGEVNWRDFHAEGDTSLGAALALLAAELNSPAMPLWCPPPTVALFLGSEPTDDWHAGLKELACSKWGPHLTRLAFAIGDLAPKSALDRFLGHSPPAASRLHSPRSIAQNIIWEPFKLPDYLPPGEDDIW
ncbi:hypothetical protein OG302_00735 [Streptomyces sp. NBC_01283]|uniref:hypothetical protein n=1 Tax=Streptomyces sp. NBC_01283 TaxID=2903812 RepID=UPI00352BE959|nr:hypothetical protein OG302_00735 [Streptomyces sp. NBC_01283]